MQKPIKIKEEEVNVNPMSEEWLQEKLDRFRVQLTNQHDIMDSIAWTISAIERDLQKIQTEDLKANEKNA
jgi:hypothetical protein